MAETTDKSKKKAPAKPRAAAGTAKKTTAKGSTQASSKATQSTTARVPSHEEIARLAEQYWAERGHRDGHAEQDWLRAEQELLKQAS